MCEPAIRGQPVWFAKNRFLGNRKTMPFLHSHAYGARLKPRAVRRYRSGVCPLEDRVTMSASGWSQLDPDEAAELLAGTNYVAGELIVALDDASPSFADVLAIEAARDAATAAAVQSQTLLDEGAGAAPALYRLSLDVAADFAETLAAISNWTSVAWVSPNFTYDSSVQTESVGAEATLSLSQLGPDYMLAMAGNATGSIDDAAETDTFTLDLLAGQQLSVGLTPAAGLRTVLSVFGPGVNASTTAASAGASTHLENLVIATAGTYTITVSSAAGTGGYTVRAVLNAALELEEFGGPSNNSKATAQDLTGAWIPQTGGSSRVVIDGRGNWVDDSISPTVNFANGALPSGWTTFKSQTTGRVAVGNTPNPLGGGYSLYMDSGTAGTFNLNEAEFVADFTGYTNIRLRFWQNEWNDEEDVLPTSFTGHVNGDGISFSVDGVNWYRLWNPVNHPFTNTWIGYSVDLSAAAAAAGVTLGANTRIRLQQYDDGTIAGSGDGRAWDDFRFEADIEAGFGEDWYAIELEAGQSLNAQFSANYLNPAAQIDLFDASGIQLGSGSNFLELDLRHFKAPTAGKYFLRVNSFVAQPYQLLITRGAVIDSGDSDPQQLAGGESYLLGSTYFGGDGWEIRLTQGVQFTAATETPSVGLIGSANTLDPVLYLVDPQGDLVASADDNGPDGRNALLTYLPTQTGVYRLYVQNAQSTSGVYGVALAGSGNALGPATSLFTAPQPGATLKTPFTTLDIYFSDFIFLPSLHASDLTINGIAAASLYVSPFPNVDGKSATFTFATPDEGPVNFAIAAGAITNLHGDPFAALNLQVTYALNRAPVLDHSVPLMLSLLEDPTTNLGVLVADLLATGAGGDPISDANVGDSEGIAIVGRTGSGGRWQYTTNGGSFWVYMDSPSPTFATLLAADAQTRIRFVPDANYSGTTQAALSFRAWDRSAGGNGNAGNVGAGGGYTAFSAETGTVTLVVTSINDAPSFVKGADQIVPSDITPHTVANWATSVSAGPLEAGQTVQFLVTSDNPSLFSAGPAISPTGTLTYTFAAGASGTAVVSVQLKDDGGTAGGGTDASAVQTFQITAVPAPVISPVANQTIDEDGSTGPLSFTVTDVDSPLASLMVSTSASNTTLVPAASRVVTDLGGGNYQLTVTPAADRFGSSTITITVSDGTHSTDLTFNLTVNQVNDAPSFVVGGNQSVLRTAGPQSVGNWATAISQGPNETGQALTFEVLNDNPALFSAGPTVSSNGTLSYTPSGVIGTAVVRVRLKDSGGTSAGGADTSALQTFTIQIGNATISTQAGSFDTTFGAGGLFSNPTASQAFDSAITVLPDGKVLIAGPKDVGTANGQLAVWRLNADGTLDASFGEGGVALHPSGTGASPGSVLVQADGKIVVTAWNADRIYRFNADGSVDTTFDGDGIVNMPSGHRGWSGRLQSDGKIVVAGYSVPNGPTELEVYRFNTDGTLDSTFGGDGIATIPFDTTVDNRGHDLAILPDGKILVVGQMNGTTIAARLNSDGSLDSTFGTAGRLTAALSGSDNINSVALQADGKFVVAGSRGLIQPSNQFLVARFHSNGTLDTTFSGDGIALPATGTAEKVLIDAEGRIVLVGATNGTATAQIAVLRLLADGSLDTSFDGDGVTLRDLTPGRDTLEDAEFLPNGDIVVTGVNDTVFAARFRGSAQNVPGAGPAVTPVADVATNEDTAATINFEVSHSLYPVSSLTVTAVSDNPTLLPSGALVISDLGNGNRRMVVSPAANRSGTALVTISVSDGTLSYAETFTLTVEAVNDAPSFVLAGDQYSAVDSGAHTVANFASNISVGPLEPGQSASFLVLNDNAALFAVAPTINAAGTLTYTFAAGVTGSATVTVRLQDDGGTSGGGADMSAPQIFVIGAVTAPTIGPIADAMTDEDGSTFVEFLVTPGTGATTPPTLSALASNTTLLPAAGFTLADLGGGLWRLTITPAANRNGTTSFTVTAAHGSMSSSSSFNVDVRAVNDAPSFTAGPPLYADPFFEFLRSGWATGISVGPNEAGQNITFQVTVDNPSLFAALPTIDADGMIRFRGNGATGTAVVTVRLADDGGTAFGGTNISAPQSFEIEFSGSFLPSGILDPTFDADGVRVLTSGIGSQDVIRDLARQSDGKIVAVGYVQTGVSTSPAVVLRYNADGTLDTSFGVGGRVTIANTLNTTAFRLYGVEITTDGKIVVAGDAPGGFYIARLNADGTFDTSFDGDGAAVINIPGSNTSTTFPPLGLTLQADGKAVVTRYLRDSTTGSSSRISVARITTTGAVDTTFGTSGFILVPWRGSGNDEPHDVAVQADGKIVIVGSTASSGGGDFIAMRFTSSGATDTSFGTGGTALVNVGASASSADSAYRVLIQSDGKIVIGGTTGTDIGLVRLTTNGSLDTTFDGDGKVVTNLGATDQGFALAIQSDGKILVGGSISTAGNDFALARYTIFGALDATFDGDGIKTHSFGAGSDQVYGLIVQPDGKIVVGGLATNPQSGNDFALARFAADGALDTSFGGGVATSNFGPGAVNQTRTITLSDGRILIAATLGENANTTSGRYGVWRLLDDGSLDPTFGTSGFVIGGLTGWSTLGFARQNDGKLLLLDGLGNRIVRLTTDGALDTSFAAAGVASYASTLFSGESALAVQSDGSIVVVGWKTVGSFEEVAVARFTVDGVLDTSFDGDGQALVNLGSEGDRALDVAIQADGKIVVVGTADVGPNDDFAIVRLNVDGSLDATFSGDGKIIEPLSGSLDRARSVIIQSDGKIVVAGVANGDFAVVRYAADGTLDTSFSGDGTFTLAVAGTDEAFAVMEQADGRLAVTGYSNFPSTTTLMTAFRLTAAGTIDASFDDDDGIVTYGTWPTNSTVVGSGTLQADGKLLAVGALNEGGTYHALVLRYLTRPTAAGATPTISPVSDRSVDEDGTISFTITIADDDTPLDWLSLGAETTNPSLFTNDNITFTPLGGGQWSVVVKPRLDQFGTSVVTLTVFDGASVGRRSFNVVVSPVNDATSFVKGADVHAGAGVAANVAGWATSLSRGSANEWAQNLSFQVTAADPALFDVLPTIDATGRLSFTAKASAAGQSTVVTVRLHDDGGTDRGGVDTSAPQTFTIAVGNAPVISPIADRAISEGGQTIVDFSVSDLDTSLGSIVVSATSGDTAVLPALGVVLANFGSGNYRLTLTPAADRFGPVAITVVASDGVYSSTRTFVLDVANVNDAPSFTAGPDQFVDAGSGPQAVVAWAKNISRGPFEGSQQRTFEVTVDDPSLFSVGPTISADGTLSYTPAAGKSGTATVTVVLKDDGGTAGGGVDASPPQTFKIRLLTGSSVAGDFDTTFDVDGLNQALSPGKALEQGRDVALQSDGKLVVVGITSPGGPTEVFVRRYLADGTRDASFGVGGIARFGLGASSGIPAAVEIASDGKIYVAYAAFSDVHVARLNADGTLDAAFGVGGIGRADLPATTETAVGMALQSDGKVVVVGSSGGELGAVRFNADGALDTAFGVGGLFRQVVGTSTDVLNDVVVQNDGRIVAVGTGTLPSSTTATDWIVVRLTAAGALDTSFSGDGIFVGSPFTTSVADQAFRVAVDGLDRIVVGGNLGSEFGFLRLHADGSFDTSFGGDGWATINPTSSTDTVTGMVILPDARITAVGNTTGTTTPGLQVARLQADGSPDLTFDHDGRKSILVGDGAVTVYAAALQADGRLVVAGQALVGSEVALAVVRLASDGTPDAAFAGDGILLELPGPASIQFESLAYLPDGSYVVGGFRYAGSGTNISSRFFVSRYTAAGALDTSFGTGGYAYHPSSTSPAYVAVQSDGKIVGISFNSSSFGLVRFNADGTVDTTFGTAGVAALPAGFTSQAVSLQSDGKILVGGRQSSNVAVARYNADGTLDTTFSGDGVMNFDAGGTGESVEDLVQQADGRIVVGGTASNGTNNDFFVARLAADGTLDTSFDVDGYVRATVGANSDNAGAMVVQADGKIVIGGATSPNTSMLNSSWALFRYNTDGTLDTTFGGDGLVIYPSDAVNDTLGDLVLQADGRLVGVGVAQGPVGSDTIVVRFLTDGRLDPTFAEDGVLHVSLASGTDVGNGVVIDPAGKIVVVGTADVGRRFEGRIFRLLNQVDEAPTVAGVYLRGSAWSSSYLNYLDTNGLGATGAAGLGYALSGGASQLTVTVPWSNVDRITIRFDRDVDASINSLVLVNSAGDTVAASGFRFIDGRTVEFSVPTLANDKYLIHVGAADLEGIADLALDGEWTTSTSTFGQGPADGSGNGSAGGSFNFRFNVLPADFDSSGAVAFGEIGQLRLKIGLTTSSPDYSYRFDFDGSGSISFGEYGQARLRLGTSLSGLAEPSPPPEAAQETRSLEGTESFDSFDALMEFDASEKSTSFESTASTAPMSNAIAEFAAAPPITENDPPESIAVAESFGQFADATQSLVVDADSWNLSTASTSWIAGPVFSEPAVILERVPASSPTTDVERFSSTANPASANPPFARRISVDMPFARFERLPGGAPIAERFGHFRTDPRTGDTLRFGQGIRLLRSDETSENTAPDVPRRADGSPTGWAGSWHRLRRRPTSNQPVATTFNASTFGRVDE
jgi:uncharacterized delta-60 repeat protein